MISALLILILAGHSFGTEAGQELVQISGVTQPHAPFAYASNTAPPHTPVSLDERPAEDRALKLDAEAHVAHPLSSDNPESSRRHEVAITIDAVTARGSDDAAVMNQNRAGKEKHKATAKPHSGTKQRKELELVKGKKHPVSEWNSYPLWCRSLVVIYSLLFWALITNYALDFLSNDDNWMTSIYPVGINEWYLKYF